MPIDFTPERWEQLRTTYRQWWAGELDRPLIPIELVGRDPGRPQPDAPLLSQETCTDLSYSPEQLIDRIDYELSRKVYLGDAFPWVNMDVFGPGVAAAFMGARLDNSTGRVWFWPPHENQPIEEIHLAYDPENPWLKRLKEICAAAMERWQGQVLMGMTDLGGNLDIPATFVTTQAMLMELYDHPEEVVRLTWEAHECWHRFYAEINAILQPTNPGYSDWSGIYSEQPSYMLQCDFAYMIGPQMFEQFVLPELQATCKRLPRSFYHLDGIGQIHHLDLLLTIPELDGVQWIPGDGKPNCAHWPDLYRKIHAAGKKIQIINGGFVAVEAVMAQVGSAKGIQYHVESVPIEAEVEIRAGLARFGIG
jgi:5-methyltetrahydrofolate--homocysteine methyltransferase